MRRRLTRTLTRRDWFRDPAASVAVRREVRQVPFGQHRHEFFEIAVILAGAGVHATGGFRHRLTAGDVLFLDPRRAHGYEEPRNLHLLNIMIPADTLARIGRELAGRPGFHALFSVEAPRKGSYDRRLRLAPPELEQIGEWAARIEEEEAAVSGSRRGRGPRGGRLLQEAYLTLIVDVLSRKTGRPARGPVSAPSRPAAAMGRVLGWIESGLARPLGVPELAARAGMSLRTFHRAFRSATGRSPGDYIATARLERAADRLVHGPAGETVTEAAFACGFDDGNYFSRAFRRFAGETPTAYRAARRGR